MMLENQINNKADFVNFVLELSQDYKENLQDWENDNIGSFLEALAAWVNAIDGY